MATSDLATYGAKGSVLLIGILALTLGINGVAHERHHPRHHLQRPYYHHHDHWRWQLGLSALWLSPWVWDSYRWQQPRYALPPAPPVPLMPSAPLAVRAPVQQITSGFRMVDVGVQGRSELPANARVIQDNGRLLYEWQGQRYRFDWAIQQYVPLTETPESQAAPVHAK
ncbi:hypothetical protein [Shewanella sp. YIC-542]|uniref:hypothetical protein n=1 Tax=Shewanella mytili TaxID=3377111 RepID=UPI00398F50DB